MVASKTYRDPSFGAESLFICPIEIDTGDGTPANILSYTSTKAIRIIEAGIMITEAVVGTSVDAVVVIKEGATELFSVSIPDTTAVGVTVKDIVGESVAIAAGDTLIFNHKTKATGGTPAGKGYMYIKYAEQFA